MSSCSARKRGGVRNFLVGVQVDGRAAGVVNNLVGEAFGQAARDAGIAVSMGSHGDCFDNAVAERLRHAQVPPIDGYSRKLLSLEAAPLEEG